MNLGLYVKTRAEESERPTATSPMVNAAQHHAEVAGRRIVSLGDSSSQVHTRRLLSSPDDTKPIKAIKRNRRQNFKLGRTLKGYPRGVLGQIDHKKTFCWSYRVIRVRPLSFCLLVELG